MLFDAEAETPVVECDRLLNVIDHVTHADRSHRWSFSFSGQIPKELTDRFVRLQSLLRLGEAEPVAAVVLHYGFGPVELLPGRRHELDALPAKTLVMAMD